MNRGSRIPAAIRTTVHGSSLSALEVGDRTPPQLSSVASRTRFRSGRRLDAEDIGVGMPFTFYIHCEVRVNLWGIVK
jgi:hypothetical protein